MRFCRVCSSDWTPSSLTSTVKVAMGMVSKKQKPGEPGLELLAVHGAAGRQDRHPWGRGGKMSYQLMGLPESMAACM